MGGWINVEALLYAVAGGLFMLFIFQLVTWQGEKAVRGIVYQCNFSHLCDKAGHSEVCDDLNLAFHLCKGFLKFMELEKMEAVKN